MVEGETFADIINETLDIAEGCMAFVAMVNILFDTELLEKQHAADAKEDLLLETILPVATIEGVGDGTVVIRVEVIVGVEEVEFHAADIDAPYVSMNLIVHVGYVDDKGLAVGIHLLFDGQTAEVLGFVVGNLLTIHAEGLCEIAKTIKESYSHHIDIGVTGFLNVVACEDTETAGVDLQDLVQAILHAEIGHGSAIGARLHVHVCAELLVGVVHALEDITVLREL